MLNWEEVKLMVATDKIGYFRRSKESAQEYAALKNRCRRDGITLYQNLVVHSLDWYVPIEGIPLGENGLPDDENLIILPLNPVLFADPSDYKFLVNLYSYDFPKNLKHLCLWFKNFIEPDPESSIGDISDETKAVIEEGLLRLLTPIGVKRKDYVWFKNWTVLQSIRMLSHVHVIILDLQPHQLKQILSL